MNLIKTELEGVFIIEPKIFKDDRGWFYESYSEKKFKDLGLDYKFVQDNHAFSSEKNTLRGIHFQNGEFSQAKLVRVTKGAVIDVAVDLRKNSPTYKAYIAVELSEENKKQLLIPRGFGHGYVTITDNVEFQYKTDNFYNKESDRSIRFDDPELNIDWGCVNPKVSDKDKNAPMLKDCDISF